MTTTTTTPARRAPQTHTWQPRGLAGQELGPRTDGHLEQTILAADHRACDPHGRYRSARGDLAFAAA